MDAIKLQGNGKQICSQTQQALASALSGYAVSLGEATRERGTWSRTIAVRKGAWVGADVDIEQSGEAVTLEVSRASKAASVALALGLLAAISGSFLAGDPLLSLVGLAGWHSNLTLALTAIALCFVTIPLALVVVRLVGAGAVRESAALQARIEALIREQVRPI